MIPSLRKFNANEAAQERLKIIQFYDAHGETETKKYFGVNRKTIWAWKNKLKVYGGRLESLIAQSTRPKHVRRMMTDLRIVAFIRQLRADHPRLGKVKIKPLLDQQCQALGIKSLSVSAIGKVIKRHRLFFQPRGKVYHDPNSHFAQKAKSHRPKRTRVRYAPKP